MATYAIGDVQGCFESLQCLLDKLAFDPSKDKLWLAGDLVNRGPDSLSTLRLVKQLDAKVVLGNHDLHLLACYYGRYHGLKKKDTMSAVLEAPDCEDLMVWLRHQPLMVWDKTRNVVMTHAGMPHIWSIQKARKLSREVETVLCDGDYVSYFDEMYGNDPDCWAEELSGMARLKVITNYLTRMRFITPEGRLDFAAKEKLESAPDGFFPWFEYPREESARFIFGHWAALNGRTGKKQYIGLDTGCVWGGGVDGIKPRYRGIHRL